MMGRSLLRMAGVALFHFLLAQGFTAPQLFLSQLQGLRRPSSPTTRIHAFAVPENEFSRRVQPNRVLRSRTRDFQMEISATPEECQALAQRFDLGEIAKLEASVIMRQERVGASRRSGAETSGVEVEGTIATTVTQTCVRTNEDFSVDLELPLYAIVRPVVPISALLQKQQEEEILREELTRFSDNNKKAKKPQYRPQQQTRTIDDIDVLELQRMLQQDMSVEDDVLMEDEAIYPQEGMMDIGELVAQLFWLQLDPYPKKPGSKPVQRSITG